MTTAEMLLRLGSGVGLGTVIGFERQYRARMAGLRTNALVAAGATLFALLSVHGSPGPGAAHNRTAAQAVREIACGGAAGTVVVGIVNVAVRPLGPVGFPWAVAFGVRAASPAFLGVTKDDAEA